MGIRFQRAVFLDRDGVINRPVVRNGRPYAPLRLEDLQVFSDVPGALRRLGEAGFALIIVTNQPEVARGTLLRSTVDEMHAHLTRTLPIDEFRVCDHDDADHCQCRKPKPGLLIQASAKHGLSLPDSFMVGDRWRDIGAGKAAGCATIFVDRGYEEHLPDRPDAVVRSLGEAADWILARVKET